MLESLFVVFFMLCLYPYLLYPLAVILWARAARAGGCRDRELDRPSISIVISVYNEEKVIEEKIANALSLFYPAELLEILVVSDGSTDRTDDIVAAQSPRVTLRAFAGRMGKTACLNRVVPEARGEIILFTDANSMFPRDLLLRLTSAFVDGDIGLVTGWTKYRRPGGEEATVGVYGRLEMMTKVAESAISSCVGADGAVFAIRKELYRPLEDQDINDFVIPLQVVAQGRRVVLDPSIYCIENPGESTAREFRRQVRITTRTLGAIARNRCFLNPLRYGSFSFFLASHKVGRFLVPFTFAGTLATAMLLSGSSLFHALVALFQMIFICIGVGGLFRPFSGWLTRLASFFLLTIAAQAVGWLRWLSGKTDIIWKPAR